ncbi:MAG: hypothetical protein A4E30_00117 [Methanomassiliicoccales archaeon PtaB.Bin215]|nr:MAG: hypothetical protein A4E30_00117 [Methanomassiliicoccales archaeon PtaB.Bin215]
MTSCERFHSVLCPSPKNQRYCSRDISFSVSVVRAAEKRTSRGPSLGAKVKSGIGAGSVMVMTSDASAWLSESHTRTVTL